MNLGVRAQLLAASGAILVLLVAVGGLATLNLGAVADGGSRMYDDAFVPAS